MEKYIFTSSSMIDWTHENCMMVSISSFKYWPFLPTNHGWSLQDSKDRQRNGGWRYDALYQNGHHKH